MALLLNFLVLYTRTFSRLSRAHRCVHVISSQVIKDKKADDKAKEQVREEYLLDREAKKLIQDAERKLRDGWSTDHALKGLKADVSADCEMIPEGFTQESIKEERRLNGVMRQDLRYDIAVEGVCARA